MPLILQDVVRVDRALGEPVAGAHLVALVHVEVLAVRDQVLLRLAVLAVGPMILRMPRVISPNSHAPVDLGDDGRLLRPARLEQLGHARQAAGDVARLADLAADLDQHVAGAAPACPSRTSRRAPVGSG